MEKQSSPSTSPTGRKKGGTRKQASGRLPLLHKKECWLVFEKPQVVLRRTAHFYRNRVIFKLCKGHEFVLHSDSRIHFEADGKPIVDMTNLMSYSLEGLFEGKQSANLVMDQRSLFRFHWSLPLYDDPPRTSASRGGTVEG